jgi:PAS domain S-box-containing protein
MLNSTLTLSRVGIILNMDADMNDPLFKQGADYDYKNFTLLFNAEHHKTLRKFLDQVFTAGKLQCTEFYNGASFYQLKCVVVHPGQALCIITNNTTQRKQLTELEERNFKALVNTSSDWVWSFDTNFTLITANRAFFEARRQVNNEELRIGDNIFKNIQESTYKKWRPIYERALQGEVFTFEEKRNNKVHDYYVEVYLSPVYNDENVIIGCLGITRDITERKTAQFAIEGYTAKLEEFAFKTSHELRRPIANIMGMTTLLSTGGLDNDEKAKAVDYISSSVNEVDTIVISMIELIDQYKNNTPS